MTAILWGSTLYVAHLGDSRASISKEEGLNAGRPAVSSRFLTQNHKPDDHAERSRIERSGGSVVFLHGNRPYLRGGDFMARQNQGGPRPMQLNYSRAFGAPALQPYGLIAEPDICTTALTRAHRVFINASDGLWDVIGSDEASSVAWAAHQARSDPAAALVTLALDRHASVGSCDNVTVGVIIFSS